MIYGKILVYYDYCIVIIIIIYDFLRIFYNWKIYKKKNNFVEDIVED